MSQGDYFAEETLLTLPAEAPPTGDLHLEQEPSLILLTGPNAGLQVSLNREILVGRGAECALRVLEADVSRVHARIFRHIDGNYVVEDMESRNGTTVNDAQIRRHELRVGERVRFGRKTVALFTHLGDLQHQILHEQKLEALGRLAGGVAHDFNNLLGAVLSNVSFLIEDWESLDKTEIEDALNDVSSAATRAADLTRQLLGFARKGKYEHKPTEITHLVEDVLQILTRTTDAAIDVHFECDNERWVLGDRSQLHQVLLNLCINARDAMPDGGELRVRVDDAEEHVVIEVSDTGEGMAPEICERVFEPFFTTKELGRGTGLGLATAYGVVKNHGGEIVVDSEVGRGTTFRIFLVRHESVRDEPVRRIVPRTAVRGTVLIVDDEDLHRRGCARLLRQSGYDVITAQDGPEALRLYKSRQGQIDVVLLDLRMPKMAGDEVARRLAAIDADVRILATSGYADARNSRMILDGIAAGFLRKPYASGMLEESIQRVLRHQSAAVI